MKKLKLFQSSFYLYSTLVKTTIMILHLGLNFVGILVVNNNPLEDFP